MQSRILFLAIFAIICLSFALASIESEQSKFSLPAWKRTWGKLSTQERADLKNRFVHWYKASPAEVQDALVEDVVEIMVEDELIRANQDSDLAEEAEFVCGGICIGIGAAVAAGIAWAGHSKGKKDGSKAAPIHHHHRDDDMILGALDKLLKIHDAAKTITKNLLSSKNPGVHTHVYHDDDEAALNKENFLQWARAWGKLSKEGKAEIISNVKAAFEKMTSEELEVMQDRVSSIIAFQKRLATEDSDMAEEAEFVCGGFCIAAAVAAGVGIWQGAHKAGKEKTQRHVHHHYRK